MEIKKYNKKYFIKKFSAIPDKKWRDDGLFGNSNTRACALGHCRRNGEYKALLYLFPLYKSDNTNITIINDGESPKYQQSTPKARVLVALNDLPD